MFSMEALGLFTGKSLRKRLNHARKFGVKERLAAKETDIANIPAIKNVQSCFEAGRVNPAEIRTANLSPRKITEITSGIAGVSDSNIAKAGPTTAEKRNHVPSF
jgi:hypothetical protein